MSTGEHARHEQDTAAYLLGSLGELERHAFERHLARCEDCRRDLEELRPAVQALPRSVAPVVPPPSLKASLMETIEREAAPHVQRRRRRSRPIARWPSVAWAAAAVVLAAGIAIGLGVAALVRDDHGPRTLAAQVDGRRLPGAGGDLTIAADRASAVLRVSGMPRLAPGRTYEVWLQRGDRVIAQSLFGVDAAGRGSTAVVQSLAGADAVMVTREPAGGSTTPSERPVLTFSF